MTMKTRSDDERTTKLVAAVGARSGDNIHCNEAHLVFFDVSHVGLADADYISGYLLNNRKYFIHIV
ncbi:hypothetical protein OsJ_15865 [Oryza sativa Japonica Group]|uniref:Uncharacterized protein n=2 Tax=Oryza TaxID=4527 RepID=A3AWM6_ORYSJ|nr:hypothetical protein OsJ_15865 [Oryza sativa Japonica Group]